MVIESYDHNIYNEYCGIYLNYINYYNNTNTNINTSNNCYSDNDNNKYNYNNDDNDHYHDSNHSDNNLLMECHGI